MMTSSLATRGLCRVVTHVQRPVWPDCWRMGATPKQATRRRVNSVGYCYHVDERLNGCQHQIGHWSASGTASIGA